MTQPTQDTDITSSISPLFHVQDDALSDKVRAGNSVKKLAEERPPTSFKMETSYQDKGESEIDQTSKCQGSELVKSLGETFPWLIKFSKVIQSAVGSKNPKLLDRLLFVYIENMSRDVNTCYTKPYRATKLKNHISETLMFFHLYWKNIKERVDDRNQYLDKMSKILGMYFDMELKASRRGKDSASKIASKLLTAMFIYLDNSEEHIFRILFRVKFITKNYSDICAPIFKKIFSGIFAGMKCVTDVKYVRYLLALKLWKKIKDDLQEKKKINEIAVSTIGQRIPSMNNELAKIIPKPPDFHKNETLWLLQPNLFDLRKACDEFINYELNERIISLPESIDRLKIMDNNDTPSMQIGLESIDRLQQKDVLLEDKSSDIRQQSKKIVKLRRFKPSFPKLRPGEVVFIDLTAENEDNKQQGDGKKKKKKDKKKLKWLKEASRKSKLKKERNKISDKTWIEKADAHSTEDHEKEMRICDPTCTGCKFCSLNGNTKYTITKMREEEIESSDNLVSSQTSMIHNDKAHSSTIIYEPQGSYYAFNEVERNAAMNIIRKEPRDSLDDSKTNNNCDKIIINDSSSFNINNEFKEEHLKKLNLSPSFVSKIKSGDIPSTSLNKNVISKTRDCINENCVVSTTASLFEFNSEEQINVISGSTNETSESNIRGTVNNSEKSFATLKIKKSGDTCKNSSKDVSSGELVNNKLQNSLIHALSLDEIIQIGRDDMDSQSEDDEDKETSNKSSCEQFSIDNDFFQIPDIQLCDDLTNDNEVRSLAGSGSKSKVDEFENIDILDSILNGDMSMQDILEEQQHLSMNSACNEPSNNMLGFFTEFFKESEVTIPIERNYANERSSHIDGSSKSLPEGSLGMTGILNSLLDSDLTSIHSPPSDFMYSNVQTVDPRLIRKSPTAERAAFLNDFSTVSDIFSQKEQSEDDNFTANNSLTKKTKDQLFLDQKDSLNCNDLEEFGLNNAKQTTFEMPVLEEELIQLPQDPLIEETIITQISPRSCDSPLQSRSEIVNLNEVKSTDFCNIQLSESSYDYSKFNNYQEFTSLRLKDIIQHSANEVNQDLTNCTLTDFTPPHSVDPPQSPYTFVLSPAQTISHSPTHSTRISRHSISANMLTPPPSVPQLINQNNLTPPPTPQQNQNYGETLSGNFQKSQIHHLSMDSSLSCRDDSQQQDLATSVRKNGNSNKTTRGKSQTKLVNTKLKTNSNEIKDKDSRVDDDQQNAALHLAHVKVALTRLTREEINSRASGEQKSVLKSSILINRKGAQRQLQRIDLREFGIAANKHNNKSVLINLNGKTKPALVFERNIKGSDIRKSVNNINDVNNRSSNNNNIVYKLNSNSVKPATSKDKTYNKMNKVVNFNMQQQRNEIKDIVVANQNMSDIPEDKSNQIVIRQRSSSRRIKTQANKSPKEINSRKNIDIPITEEPSMKKRKINSKLIPMLENEGIIYAVNQQKQQEKHSNVMRRDFVARRDRTKNKKVV